MRAKSIYLGLGSNLGNRRRHLRLALQQLKGRGVRLVETSSVYETAPVGVRGQRDFLNMVCRVDTVEGPLNLLHRCRQTELQLGRQRRSVARTIDIDLLFFRDLLVSTPRLTIPHPRLYCRRFVLCPMVEIAPDFRDPGSGLSMTQLLQECGDPSRIRPVADFATPHSIQRKPLL